MILLTGATGLIGSALLPSLIAEGHEVRCLVRDPTGLGPNRARVQMTLGDLANHNSLRQAVRGVHTVVHMAASIRDQPGGTIEELNGIGTLRLLHAAENSKVERFIFFGAMGAGISSPTRFFRTKALAARKVLASSLDTTVLSPSIVYAPGDSFLTMLGHMSLLPWMPVAGRGNAEFQPIWAADVATAVESVLRKPGSLPDVLELAGPQTLTYNEIARLVLASKHRHRPLIHVPLALVKKTLNLVERVEGEEAFATWQEAQLMEVSMTSPRGTADIKSLGVEPEPMADVLGAG